MQTSDAIAAVVGNATRFPTAAVTLTAPSGPVDLTAMTSEVKVERKLSGDLPDAVTLVSGPAAASATLTVDVEDPTTGVGPLDLFHPRSAHPAAIAQADQPLAPVSVDLGFDGTNLRQVSGGIRSTKFSEADRSVDLTLVDGFADMRAKVSLPAAGTIGDYSTRNRLSWPVNTAAVVAHVLHANGVRLTPAGTPSTLAVSIPGVAGYVCETGWTDYIGTGWGLPVPPQSARYETGPCGWALVPPALGTGLATTLLARHSKTVGTSDSGGYRTGWLQVEFWADFSKFPTNFTSRFLRFENDDERGDLGAFELAAGKGTLALNLSFNGSSTNSLRTQWSGSVAQDGWHHVAVRLARNASQAQVGIVRVDGVQVTTFTNTDANAPGIGTAQATIDLFAPLQGLLVHAGSTATSTPPTFIDPTTWTPQADLDLGNLELDCLPVVKDDTSVNVLTAVARAEVGAVGFAESGRFYFRNRTNLNLGTTPVKTISTDIASERSGGVAIDSIRNAVTAKVRPVILQDRGLGNDGSQYGYSSDPIFTVPALRKDTKTGLLIGEANIKFPKQTSRTAEFTSKLPLIPSSRRLVLYGSAGQAWDYSGIVLCEDVAGNQRHTSGGVTAYVEMADATTVRVTVNNQSTSDLWAVWPTEFNTVQVGGVKPGMPSLILHGKSGLSDDEAPEVSIVSDDTVAAVAASQTKYGVQPLDLGTSVWLTSPESVLKLANDLASACSAPTVLLDEVTVPGDPRVQIGDVLTLTDAAGVYGDFLVRVMGVTRTMNTSGLTDTYSVKVL